MENQIQFTNKRKEHILFNMTLVRKLRQIQILKKIEVILKYKEMANGGNSSLSGYNKIVLYKKYLDQLMLN